jgi:hypothetical protein
MASGFDFNKILITAAAAAAAAAAQSKQPSHNTHMCV